MQVPLVLARHTAIDPQPSARRSQPRTVACGGSGVMTHRPDLPDVPLVGEVCDACARAVPSAAELVGHDHRAPYFLQSDWGEPSDVRFDKWVFCSWLCLLPSLSRSVKLITTEGDAAETEHALAPSKLGPRAGSGVSWGDLPLAVSVIEDSIARLQAVTAGHPEEWVESFEGEYLSEFEVNADQVGAMDERRRNAYIGILVRSLAGSFEDGPAQVLRAATRTSGNCAGTERR